MSDDRDRRDDDADPQPGAAGSSGPSVWLILFGVFALAGVIFAFQNGQEVQTEFLWLDGEFKLWVSILASIALGVALDRFVLAWWRRSRRKE